MSLTTRCPACGTMFKVVADQLKIAQGWVRCGQCAEVFDASAQLQADTPPAPLQQNASLAVNLDVGEAAPRPAEPLAMPAVLPDPDPEPETALSPTHKTPEPPERPALERGEAAPESTAADFDPAAWKRAQLQGGQKFVAPLISESAPDVPDVIAQLARTTSFAPASSARDEADQEEDKADPEVSFVRDARRRAFWKTPLVRGILGVVLIFLLALLALQWMVQHKDRLAALKPQWTPVLQALCGTFQCEIRPPRHIESLLIDSSSFTKTGIDTYRLSFALKNAGDIALEVPSLELTLTDTQDQAVVRRVVLPRQFGASVATLAARSELAGVVSLKVSADAERSGPPSSSATAPRAPFRVAGYRILAFYP